jgi:hypothetical protein
MAAADVTQCHDKHQKGEAVRERHERIMVDSARYCRPGVNINGEGGDEPHAGAPIGKPVIHSVSPAVRLLRRAQLTGEASEPSASDVAFQVAQLQSPAG